MLNPKIKKVLIVHPYFNIIGGAELVSLNIINHFIKNPNYTIFLLTLEPPNILAINKYTGLNLCFDRINIIKINFFNLFKVDGKFILLKIALLNRYAKNISKNFDICISTYNEMDFGKTGIQYIHHPLYSNLHILQQYNFIPKQHIFNRIGFLYKYYIRILRIIGKISIKGIQQNITIVNSYFIKTIVDKIYNIQSVVIYPGYIKKTQTFSETNWMNRKFRFVTIGRISQDKDYDKGIHIMKFLSEQFENIEFIIIGHKINQQYFKFIADRINNLNIPAKIIENVSKNIIIELLKTSKYYLHFKENEHFGISILEAVENGCIPFIHNSGGQTEIITNKHLIYNTQEELYEKIRTIEMDYNLRLNIYESLNSVSSKFDVCTFETNFKKIINNYFH